MCTFIRPSSWAFAITSAGWIEPSWISRSAKSCARSRSARCSSVSPNETPPAVRSSMVAIAAKGTSTDWSVNRQSEPQDTGHMGVQLAASGERKEDANRARRVPSAREQEQIRTGPGGGNRPVLRMAANDVERVRDRDTLEPEVAQETIRSRLERR